MQLSIFNMPLSLFFLDVLRYFYLVVIHVLVVPVALQPVLRSVLLDKVIDSVSEVVGLQQQQLDDEVTNLRLVVLVATHCLDDEREVK